MMLWIKYSSLSLAVLLISSVSATYPYKDYYRGYVSPKTPSRDYRDNYRNKYYRELAPSRRGGRAREIDEDYYRDTRKRRGHYCRDSDRNHRRLENSDKILEEIRKILLSFKNPTDSLVPDALPTGSAIPDILPTASMDIIPTQSLIPINSDDKGAHSSEEILEQIRDFLAKRIPDTIPYDVPFITNRMEVDLDDFDSKFEEEND